MTKELSEHEGVCMHLAELERWAPIVGRLRDHEVAQMARFLRQKFRNLAKFPAGTDEQQCEALERLTKLREGPLGTRGNRILKAALNKIIKWQLAALSSTDSFHGHKVC